MSSSHISLKETQTFREALENPMQAYEQLQTEGGKPVIGYFTDLVPIELIHAAGGQPSRLFPSPKSDEPLDSLVQTFCCSYLRNFLSSALETDLKKAFSGFIFSNNFCDSLTNVMDIFEHAFPDFPFHVLNQPVASNNANVESFFRAELHFLAKNLAKITNHEPDDKSMQESMQLYEGIRTLQSELETAYYAHHGQVAFSDFIAALAGKELLPAQKYQEVLRRVLEEFQGMEGNNATDRPRIIITGGMLHDLTIFDAIEESGSSIIGELMLFGRKDYEMRFDHSKSPLEALARSYLAKVPSATRYDLSRKTESLFTMIKEKNAAGVIHLNWKFCDPDAFEAVMIKNALEKEKMPFLMIETDPQRSNLEQIKTRCQAF
ncbi:MAG: 2-hydroxyacyl-CoA dehydratase subunit D, partial [Candidatus Hodarchaeales archaeon]